MTTNCGLCHDCGEALANNGFCVRCGRLRRYVSHGYHPDNCYMADRSPECPAVIRNVERRCNERLQALARRHPLAQGGR